MHESVHRYLVAYDIADDLRRSRIAKALETHGDRIQFSVFIVDAKPARLIRIRVELLRLMDESADSALICDLGPIAHGGTARIEFLGQRRPVTSDAPLIL